MWCFISESPYIVREYHLPKHSHGQILMDKVCDDVGLVEREYFGLRYRSKKGELLWLNLRNPLNLQLNSKPPHRLSLQVKFFVSPQELQQTISRHVYYMTLKNRLLQAHYKVDDAERLQLCVLMAQAELGNEDVVMESQYQCILPELSEHKLIQVRDAHKSAEAELSKSQAEIQFINKVSKLDGYGVEYFSAETMDRTRVVIGVHSSGLQILSKEREVINNIRFEDISKVSYHQNRFSVNFYTPTEDAEEEDQEDVVTIKKFRLTSRRSAQALFRAFTESHTFFRCENVERVVRQQHSHTGWGSLLALFRPHTDYGKIYRFDITKTRRQTYDNAWHHLHHDSSPPPQRFSVELDSRLANSQPYSTQTLRSTHSQEIMLSRQPSRASELRLPQIKAHREVDSSDDTMPEGEQEGKEGKEDGPSRQEASEAELVNSLQDELANIRDSHMCQVCLERDMSTVFCPCGHMICCERCAPECFRCPVCRADVAYVQRVFFS